MDRVDKTSPVPLIYQLSQLLRDQILAGQFGPNDPIPTEEQLAREHKISRTTVRLALAKLVNEGFVRREQGKGTFVNATRDPSSGGGMVGSVQRIARDMFDVKSTTRIIESAGMKPTTRVLKFEIEQPSARIAQLLDITLSEPVLHFERLRFADGSPLVLERTWLPQSVCPELRKEDLEGSLYRALAERCGCKLTAAHQVLRPVTLSTEDAECLGVTPGTAVMLVTGVTYSLDGRPVEAEESYFSGESVEFVVELGAYSRFARIVKREQY